MPTEAIAATNKIRTDKIHGFVPWRLFIKNHQPKNKVFKNTPFIRRENPVFRGDIRTLALALNMDLRSPLKETRRQIRDAIAELAEKKVLEKNSILTKGNIVILNRTAEALPSRRRGRRKED